MSSERLTWTLTLLLLFGVASREWGVEYEQKHICAAKGSSVVLPCSFDYPTDGNVQSVMWGHEAKHIYKGPFNYNSEENDKTSRFQYIGDKQKNCSLKIKKVELSDGGKHAFRFSFTSTTGEVDGFTGKDGPRLQVVDLKIVVTKTNEEKTYKEGDSVNLTCTTSDGQDGSCSFRWFENGQPTHRGPTLHLFNISYTNSGNYSCSPNTQSRPTSEVVLIDVEYGPKNTSVSVTPSSEVNEGDNITLTCSSTANPPLEPHTWLKMDDGGIGDVVVGIGPELSFRGVNVHDGGRYFCRVSNKHGLQKSSIVTIKVKAYWPTFTRDVSIIAAAAAAVVALMLIIIFTIKRRSNKERSPARTIHETEWVEDPEDTVYGNWPAIASSQSEPEGLTSDIVYAAVDFSSKRKSSMQQTLESCNEGGGVIYSTVCRGQGSSPAYMEQM